MGRIAPKFEREKLSLLAAIVRKLPKDLTLPTNLHAMLKKLWSWMAIATLAVVCACRPLSSSQPTLTVVGFNVESGGASPTVIAKNFVAKTKGVDVWGFSEVDGEKAARILQQGAIASGSGNFESVLGTTGRSDRLLVLYNRDRLEYLGREELDRVNPSGRVRSTLVVRLRSRDGGPEFLFAVNHLYRSDDRARHEQATALNRWAREQQLPIVAAGDYNFDWSVASGGKERDRGYDNLTADGVFQWVRPQNLLPTHCSQQHASILDFVFVAGGARAWPATSEILFPEESYCPDDLTTSDHRPVAATFRYF